MELDRPYPAEWTVRRALDAYLAENGFTRESYDDTWTKATLFGVLPVWALNTKRHRWAIMLHDLHHVATGYGTDNTGEGEISAFELASRPWALGPYVGSIVMAGAALGMLVAPRRTIAAWRACRRRSLFDSELTFEQLEAMTVGELRALLDLPTHGVAARPRARHVHAPPLPA